MKTRKGITGIENVMRNLNKEIERIKGASMKGLVRACILIRRDMDKTPPLIPVDLGNLRASSFVVAGNGTVNTDGSFTGPNTSKLSSDHVSTLSRERGVVSNKFLVAIGFSASYAEAVETDTVTKRKRPGSGGQFFESSITRNKNAIIKVIQKEAKIK